MSSARDQGRHPMFLRQIPAVATAGRRPSSVVLSVVDASWMQVKRPDGVRR